MRSRSTERGIQLTELGLGAAQFGNLYSETSDEQAANAVAEAWSDGIRYFDTAPHYGLGLSERRLGAALAAYPREQFIVSSKVGRLLVPSPETADQSDSDGFRVPADHRRVFDFSRDGVMRSLESTLERSGLDHIDIVYLHDPDEQWEAASTTGVGALVELRDQGIIRAIGVGINQSEMATRFVRSTDIDLVMIAGRYTLLEQGALADLLPLAQERNVGVVIAGVYNSGLLSRARPAAGSKYDYADAPEQLIDRATRIAQACERHGVSLPEAAIAFPLLHPAVVSVVIGARSAEQVAGNVARYLAPVPPALWAELAALGLLSPLATTVN